MDRSYQGARFMKLLREGEEKPAPEGHTPTHSSHVVSFHLFYNVNPRDLCRTSPSSLLKYSLSSNTGHVVK